MLSNKEGEGGLQVRSIVEQNFVISVQVVDELANEIEVIGLERTELFRHLTLLCLATDLASFEIICLTVLIMRPLELIGLWLRYHSLREAHLRQLVELLVANLQVQILARRDGASLRIGQEW